MDRLFPEYLIVTVSVARTPMNRSASVDTVRLRGFELSFASSPLGSIAGD